MRYSVAVFLGEWEGESAEDIAKQVAFWLDNNSVRELDVTLLNEGAMADNRIIGEIQDVISLGEFTWDEIDEVGECQE